MSKFHSIIATSAELRAALVWYPDRPFIYIHQILKDGQITPDALYSVFAPEVSNSEDALAWMEQHIEMLSVLGQITSAQRHPVPGR